MAAAKGTPLPAAAAIDAVLHRERLKHGRKRVHPIPAPVPALPDGAVVVAAGSAFTLSSGLAHRWTNEGYDPPVPLHRADGLLTPPSRSEEHTSELQSPVHLVCRLLLEKKNNPYNSIPFLNKKTKNNEK